MLEPISERSNVIHCHRRRNIRDIYHEVCCYINLLRTYRPVFDEFTSTLDFRVVDLTLIEGSVGEDKKNMIIQLIHYHIFHNIKFHLGKCFCRAEVRPSNVLGKIIIECR